MALKVDNITVTVLGGIRGCFWWWF